MTSLKLIMESLWIRDRSKQTVMKLNLALCWSAAVICIKPYSTLWPLSAETEGDTTLQFHFVQSHTVLLHNMFA